MPQVKLAPAARDMTAAADLLADSGRVHLLGGADGNANRAVRLLGQRDADLYALNLTRKRCNRVQIVHIRACMVDIPAPEHSNAIAPFSWNSIVSNTMRSISKRGRDLVSNSTRLISPPSIPAVRQAAATACECAVVFENLKQPGIGRNTDINALCNVGRELNTERRQHIVQHLGTAALHRPG